MSFWQSVISWISGHKSQPAPAPTPVPQPAPVVAPVQPPPPVQQPAVPVSKDHPPFVHLCAHKMKTKGKYAKGWPSGAIVHFTAGNDGAENTINDGISKGYTYWCIQRDGKLFAAHPADEWGYHAGESKWPGLGAGVSEYLIGIEMNAAGRLEKLPDGNFKSWFGKEIEAGNVRYTSGKDNQLTGYYHIYTPEQEETLIQTLFWLKRVNPQFSFDFVLGHDEVSGPSGIGYWRKNDPGAALRMTMPEFRNYLKTRFESEK